MSAHRATARLFGVMLAVLAVGAVFWLGLVLWGQGNGWNSAKVQAAAEGGWWTGGVAALALGARLLCLYLARREETPQ